MNGKYNKILVIFWIKKKLLNKKKPSNLAISTFVVNFHLFEISALFCVNQIICDCKNISQRKTCKPENCKSFFAAESVNFLPSEDHADLPE